MATASINDIKTQIKSVESTMQITKAMELVATSKLRALKERAEESKPYMELLSDTVKKISSIEEAKNCAYGQIKEGRTLYIVIAGDRGLAGGYNHNIMKHTAEKDSKNDGVYLPLGKKALEHYKKRGYTLFDESYKTAANINVGDCIKMSYKICDAFLKGEITSVELVYTKFLSMLTQIPSDLKILPIAKEDSKENKEFNNPIFEDEPSELLEKIVPQYIGGLIYCAVCEATASECAARRIAMNSANKNAEEMINGLTLSFNRARQAVITQEITEIVSGAEAL